MLGQNQHSSIKIGLVLLCLHIFWGFIWTNTVIKMEYANNVLSLIYLLIFLYYLYRNSRIYLSLPVVLWIPYLLYTLISCLLHGENVYFCYWGICLILVLLGLSEKADMLGSFPINLFLGNGIIITLGVYFQFIFRNIHHKFIAPLFTGSERIIKMGLTNYGFVGFTYQLDTTAVPIMYLISGMLYLHSSIFNHRCSRMRQLIILYILFMAVIMTGKRMIAILTIISPIFIYAFGETNVSKRLRKIFISFVVLFFLIYFIITNAYLLYNSNIFHRIGSIIINLNLGNDITAGRTELYGRALEVFKAHNKLIGVGVGKFINFSGTYTDAHNVYLQVLCEQGIIGEILFIIPLLLNVAFTVRKIQFSSNAVYQNIYKFLLFIQLSYIGMGMTGNPNINYYGYWVYFLAISLLGSAMLKEKKQNNIKGDVNFI